MKQNYFDTLGAALDAVREYLISTNSVMECDEDLFDAFAFGGVRYGETKHSAALLSVYKGKPIIGRMAKRGVSLTIYRMESGTYEVVCYVS